MKRICSPLAISIFLVSFSLSVFAQQSRSTQDSLRIKRKIVSEVKEDADDPQEQLQFENRKLIDPATGKIPDGMRQRELAFSATIPTHESMAALQKQNGPMVQSAPVWLRRGPYNIGGRTRAWGIDATNPDVILAGGVSGGGINRSSDGGYTWTQTSNNYATQGASCITQDIRSGKTNTWYYGTGEILGTQGRPALFLSGYVGNGIYKSNDDGQTWNVLSATVSNDPIDNDQPFNYVSNIVVDPFDTAHDIVYAAVQGGIMRSSDGGTTWTMTLGTYPGGSLWTDVQITATGVVYAALSSYTAFDPQSALAQTNGIFRSIDGIHWVNITPSNWPTTTAGLSIAIAPSDESIVYCLVNTDIDPNDSPYGSSANDFWKYTFLSNDGSGAGGSWEDRGTNLPTDYFAQYSYNMFVKVEPDNANVIYLGGTNLYCSTDGLASPNDTSTINNSSTTSTGGLGPNSLHTDEHALVFSPSSPSILFAGCDGGLFTATFNAANPQSTQWSPMNTGYYTTQFYTVALDHNTKGNNIIIGGMQDNGTAFTGTADSSAQWSAIFGGDGGYCAIENGRKYYYVSSENANIVQCTITDDGVEDVSSWVYVIPMTSSEEIASDTSLFISPFILDPANQSKMFFATTSNIWRNNDLTQHLDLFGILTLTSDWDSLQSTQVYNDSISALCASTLPAGRLYYGTVEGKVYRVDGAESGQPASLDISRNKGFPTGAYVGCIAVDSANADNAIVVFSNYHVQSLFYTSDAGNSWASIGGNLEQNTDGSGDGPSCRWASILHVGNSIVYMVGTSTGLYATSLLNGVSTVWVQEGASTIGNNIVDMIDVRQSDGFVAVGTHGAGVFSGNITSAVSAVQENSLNSFGYSLYQNYPNPFDATTNITFSMANAGMATLKVYDVFGNEVATLYSGNTPPGEQSANWDASAMPTGVYYYRLAFGTHVDTKQMILLK